MKNATKLKTTNDTSPFKLETGIPMPSRIKPNPFEGFFARMKKGESFLVDETIETVSKVKYYAEKFRLENKGVRFAFRLVDDGTRCWRME